MPSNKNPDPARPAHLTFVSSIRHPFVTPSPTEEKLHIYMYLIYKARPCLTSTGSFDLTCVPPSPQGKESRDLQPSHPPGYHRPRAGKIRAAASHKILQLLLSPPPPDAPCMWWAETEYIALGRPFT